jgi:hypothetical protein
MGKCRMINLISIVRMMFLAAFCDGVNPSPRINARNALGGNGSISTFDGINVGIPLESSEQNKTQRENRVNTSRLSSQTG